VAVVGGHDVAYRSTARVVAECVMYVWTLDAPAGFDVFDADPEVVTFE
jgi:hypothetical protein